MGEKREKEREGLVLRSTWEEYKRQELEKQAVPDQQSRSHAEERAPKAGILVPLDFPAFRVLEQHSLTDGTISIQVIARRMVMACPHGQRQCENRQDCRVRVKRESSLRGYRVRLLLHTRRVACPPCAKTLTEPDETCGR